MAWPLIRRKTARSREQVLRDCFEAERDGWKAHVQDLTQNLTQAQTRLSALEAKTCQLELNTVIPIAVRDALEEAVPHLTLLLGLLQGRTKP